MARKRKYPKVVGYWVYSIKVPSINKYYIGVSGYEKCSQRWNKSMYKGKSLEPYLNEWESMEKNVLVDNLTKEQAYLYEDNIIQALKMNDLCINELRSGLITSDRSSYYKELKKNNPEYYEREKQRSKQYNKQRYENDAEYREREKQRKKQWRLNNPDYHKEYMRQYRLKKKLEQQTQLTLFDIAS